MQYSTTAKDWKSKSQRESRLLNHGERKVRGTWRRHGRERVFYSLIGGDILMTRTVAQVPIVCQNVGKFGA